MTESDRSGYVETTAVWFGADERPVLGWLSSDVRTTHSCRVLVLPPIGYEYWSSHRTLRLMAERLAALGFVVLRMDYDGTGDSAGDQWDPDRMQAWRGSVQAGVDYLRNDGAGPVVLFGARLGATLALLDGDRLHPDAIIAWAPLPTGKRFGRELTLLGTPLPPADPETDLTAGTSYAGSVFSRQTLTDLRTVDLTRLESAPADRILILDQLGAATGTLVGALEGLGCSVDTVTVPDSDSALMRAAEDAVAAINVVDVTCDWLAPRFAVDLPPSGQLDSPSKAPRVVDVDVTPSAGHELAWHGERISEQVVRLGPRQLIGVRGQKVDPAGEAEQRRSRTTVVFVNSGSEPHVGPGRAWVEYCRDLNMAGYRTLRLDYSGWGESPDLGHAPGRPYDHHTLAETVEVVHHLHAQGERVALVGLCAGAWVILAAARSAPVEGVIAINPQLYWQAGDPVEALISDTHERRKDEMRRHRRWAERGTWSALDALGARPAASRWLDKLGRDATPVLMLFSDGDDGLAFFEDRIGRAWRRFLRRGTGHVKQIAGMDHAMHDALRRRDVLHAIQDFLDSLTGEGLARPDATGRLTEPGQPPDGPARHLPTTAKEPAG